MGIALPVAALAATVIGTGISAYGAVVGGMEQQQTANFQAQVAKNNATIAAQNATYATEAGESKAQQQEMSTRALIGSEVAAQGSSGLDVNSGSAAKVRSSAAALGTLSTMNIRNNALREAYGFTQQSQNFGSESELDTTKGKDAMTAGIVGGIGSLVGGGAKAYDMVSNFQRTGAFNPNPPDIGR